MKKIMYLVKYSSGDWEDSFQISIFVTESLEIAQNYCKRFNELLSKWKDIWHNIRSSELYDINTDWCYDRYYEIMEIKKCYFLEIEIR